MTYEMLLVLRNLIHSANANLETLPLECLKCILNNSIIGAIQEKIESSADTALKRIFKEIISEIFKLFIGSLNHFDSQIITTLYKFSK
jgi:hypothetical protein